MARSIKCKTCNQLFTPSREEIELHEEGFAPLPEECNGCFYGYTRDVPPEESGHSDADPGL